MVIQARPPETDIGTTLVNLMMADEYRFLPETNTICELIHGVVTPAPLPKHQWAVMRLARLLDDSVASTERGIVFIAPVDVYLGILEVYQSDLFVLLRKNFVRLTDHGIDGPLDLVVEVLSPSNWKKELVTKAAGYAAAGVPECWEVDPADDRLEGGAYSAGERARAAVLPGIEVAPGAIVTMPE